MTSVKPSLRRSLPAAWRRSVLAVGLVAAAAGCASAPRVAPGDETARMERGRALYAEGDYREVILTLQELLTTRPGNRFADEAIALIGRSYYEEGEYLDAEDRFRRVLREFPESPFAAESSYYLALALLSQSRKPALDQAETLAALTQFQSFISRYPKHELEERAKMHIRNIRLKLAEKLYANGELYDRVRAHRAARFYFEDRVLAEYPDTRFAPMAMVKLAESYARTEDWTQSARWAREATAALENDDYGLQPEKKLELIHQAGKRIDEAVRHDPTAAVGVLPVSADSTGADLETP